MNNAVPSYLLNRSPRRNVVASATQGLVSERPPHVSIAGNKFTLVDAAGNERVVSYLHQGDVSLDVVVVYANPVKSKVFYGGQYDASVASPPTCFSDNGVAPSINAAQPQAPGCASCPKNFWGSAISQAGKQIKACRDAKKVAVLVPDQSGDLVFQLKIPPNSLTGFNAYAKSIGAADLGSRPADISDLTTRIFFVSQGTLGFEMKGFISEETAQIVASFDSPEAEAKLDFIVGKDDQPLNPQLSLPASQDQFSQAAVAEAPKAVAPNQPPKSVRTRQSVETPPAQAPSPELLEDPSDLGLDDVPAFLHSSEGAFTTGTRPTFGIVSQAVPPSAALKGAIESAFSLPTRK
jgi:hypothetical protein